MKTNLVLFFIVFSFCYCKKSSTGNEQQPEEHHVYIGGRIRDSMSVKSAAVIWKDGTATRLTDGTSSAGVTGIAVSGNDVYACGSEGTKALLWKNGVATDISGGAPNSFTNAIRIDGNDIYVALNKQTAASDSMWGGIWKNSVFTPLPDNRIMFEISGMAMTSDGMFAIGIEHTKSGLNALYWDDAILGKLPGGAIGAAAHAVFAAGSDRYVCGFTEGTNMRMTATLWVNGTPTFMGDTTKDSYASSVWVSGTDVYVLFDERGVTGIPPTKVRLWKNGTVTDITDGSMNAYAVAVLEKNGDVYALYNEATPNNTHQVKLWKNGIVTNITDGTKISFAGAMYIQ